VLFAVAKLLVLLPE